LTTDQKGAIAESKVATAAIELGIGVSRPVSPLRYDLVFDLDTRLVRVQCKWASTNGNVVRSGDRNLPCLFGRGFDGAVGEGALFLAILDRLSGAVRAGRFDHRQH